MAKCENLRISYEIIYQLENVYVWRHKHIYALYGPIKQIYTGICGCIHFWARVCMCVCGAAPWLNDQWHIRNWWPPTVHPRTACNQSNTHTYGTHSTCGIYICEHRWHKKMPKHKKFISIYYALMELCMWKTRIMTAGNCRKEIYCWSIKCTLHWRERVAIQQIHTHRQLIILHL